MEPDDYLVPLCAHGGHDEEAFELALEDDIRPSFPLIEDGVAEDVGVSGDTDAHGGDLSHAEGVQLDLENERLRRRVNTGDLDGRRNGKLTGRP